MSMQAGADRRADLVAARVRLWEAINGTREIEVGRDRETGEAYTARESLAPLVRELRAVVKELAELGETKKEVTALDQIAAQRAARIRDAADSSHASRRSQPRRRGRSD